MTFGKFENVAPKGLNMTNSPGLVSESCHESTFKLIRHHNFNNVLFSVGATWTLKKYNNIEK